MFPPTSPAILEWEQAGSTLANAAEKYLALSEHLGDKVLLENTHPTQLTVRIDSGLQSLHTILDQQLPRAHATLARTQNYFASPICRLPPEMLTGIFLSVVYSPIDQSQPISMETTLLQMFGDLYSLQGVCRVWKDIIVSHGLFWHFSPIYCATTPDLRCTKIPNLTLERSNEGLYLAIVMKLNIPRLLRTLSISPRLRKANLIANSHSAIRDLIERLLESGPPVTLSELSLCEQRDCDETDQPGVILSNTSDCWDSFCELLKSLSILRVRGAHFDWNDLTFSHRLVELQIQNVMMGSDTEDFAEFLRNLSLAPNLRDLKIISVQSSFDLHSLTIVPPERKIYLPSLESLFLADLPYNTLITVMDHIALVSHRRIVHLTKRCIELVESPDDTIDLDEMFTHFKVVQTHIDVLALSGESDDGWLSPPDLHALLCSLPGLKTLKLSCWTLCEDQCRAIADMPVEQSESEDGEFPQLEYLDLSRVRVEEEVWLKEVIITHPTRRMVLGGSILDRAESFEFVPLRGNEPIVDWMRLKVPDFIFTDDQAQPPEFSSNVWQLW